MPQSVILISLVALGVTIADCYLVRIWWRAMIHETRWVALFPIAVPLIVFGPMFVLGRAESAFAISASMRFVLLLVCLGSVGVVSFRCAWEYHVSRRHRE